VKGIISTIKVYVLGLLGFLILIALYSTLRITWRYLDGVPDRNSTDFVFNRNAKILAFWHGRQLVIPLAYWAHSSSFKSKIHALISQHSDGRLIAFVIRLLGVLNVAGSSSKGGKEATLALIEKLRQGDSIAITPDGPRGPINKIKPGILKLADVSGAPIYPISYSAERYWQFKSWDKMILPKPFSRVCIVVGRPVLIAEKLNDENISRLTMDVEERLNQVEKEADSAWH
jgi:lysophospholipid acyltransferase (LPLAT)-like uncharacterized protein